MSGFQAVKFVCQNCGSDKWGTRDEHGHCHGGRGCQFGWHRKNDYLVFVRTADGSRFKTPGELEEILGFGQVAGDFCAPWTVAEAVHQLLESAMNRPPTLGAVQLWRPDQQRRALQWAARELLADDPVVGDRIVRVQRPEFIEEWAATA